MRVRDVKASHGWLWIKQGFKLFRISPLLWIMLIGAWLLISMLIANIPLLGSLISGLLYPVFFAGFMVGCRALEAGEQLELAHLFAGFKKNMAPLITVGGINLVGQVGLYALMSMAGLQDMPVNAEPADAVAMLQIMQHNVPILLLGLALSAPLMMALWFTPALLIFHDMKALDAVRWSFYACISNIMPFTVYGLITFLLAIAAAIPLGLGLLVLIPVLVATTYTGYRDIFELDDQAGALTQASAD